MYPAFSLQYKFASSGVEFSTTFNLSKLIGFNLLNELSFILGVSTSIFGIEVSVDDTFFLVLFAPLSVTPLSDFIGYFTGSASTGLYGNLLFCT